MLNIEKTSKITISGEQVAVLKSMCEIARRYISINKGIDRGRDYPYVDEYTTLQVKEMEEMMDAIFGA
jgi:hypothetical protein